MNLSTEQLGLLLHRSRREPRRNLKRYLKDHNGAGSAEELDQILEIARNNAEAVHLSDVLEQQRLAQKRAVEGSSDGHVTRMLVDVRVRMNELGLTQSELGERCGWNQSLVSDYLTGKKEPGSKALAKMASALSCFWKLQQHDEAR